MLKEQPDLSRTGYDADELGYLERMTYKHATDRLSNEDHPGPVDLPTIVCPSCGTEIEL